MQCYREMIGLLKDPMGTVRMAWADTGWRFVLVLAALLFILETASELAGVEQGSAWWTAELFSAVIAALWLSRHRLRGSVTETANLTVVVAIVLLVVAEGIFAYTTVSDTFAAQPIFWPFSLVLMGAAIAARVVAPCVLHPLNLWLVVYAFLAFWLHTGMWTSELSFVEPPFTWALALTGMALVARWIAGRGFDGPILSPLNLTVALYVYLQWWLEYGVNESGIGADPWGYQELYWPWLLSTLGLALGVRIIAPYVADYTARCLGSGEGEDDD